MKQVRPLAETHELAAIRVYQAGIARLAVLVHDHRAHRESVGRIPLQHGASAGRFQRVRVVPSGADVVDPAVFVPVETDRAEGELVLDQWDVDHSVVALAERVLAGEAVVDQQLAFELAGIGALGQDPYGAGE